MISNGFIINPYYELIADYKICPFSTNDIKKNRELPESEYCDTYFTARFTDKTFYYTENGREAIEIALTYFNLKKDDCVTILTTSGNYYISSCVTKIIENHCCWSRKFEPNTKLIFVNHEFGYPFKDLKALKKYNLPIIEDCAHSFFSFDIENTIGEVGDFVIYSFPKMFPIQLGGLLVSKIDDFYPEYINLDKDSVTYIKKVLSYYIAKKSIIIQERLKNYNLIANKFKSLGINEYATLEDKTIPGVFLFKANKIKIELSELKKIFYAHGIQCSVFYGDNSFFLPCHQNLCETDLDYFIEILKPFIKE